MKKKVLGLYDSNITYMEKLYKYLEDDKKIGFSLCAFTSEEKLTDFLEKEKIKVRKIELKFLFFVLSEKAWKW